MPIIEDIVLYLPSHATKFYSRRNLSEIDTIVLHQTDSEDKGKFSAYDVARYHVNNNGWAGIGYHYFITDDGGIYKTQELNTISYHASGWNNRSVGVVITGKHRCVDDKQDNNVLIGKKKYKSLVFALAKIQNSLFKKVDIIGHSKISPIKSCPNLNMEQLKEDVKKKDYSLLFKRSQSVYYQSVF